MFYKRLESEKNAKNLDQIFDIFVDLGVKVENSFPEDFYEKNAEMIVMRLRSHLERAEKDLVKTYLMPLDIGKRRSKRTLN